MGRRRVRVIVSGRVQGVFFRASLSEEAARHDAAGWVRNRPDGTVEAELQGTEEAVEALLGWCGHGPPHADVTDVEVTETEPDPAADGIVVR